MIPNDSDPDPLYGRHLRPFHGTLPDQRSPLGRWLADVATLLGCDYDTASMSNTVERLVSTPAPAYALHPADDVNVTETTATEPVVYLATTEDMGVVDTQGVSATRDGGLALLGAAWLRHTSNDAPSGAVPHLRALALDDPADRQTP